MVPTLGGIALLEDEASPASGAAFNLDRASRSDGRVTVGGLVFEVRRKGRVVVARGGLDRSYEGALSSSLEHVQEALDIWSVEGIDDLAITRVDEEHLAWWSSPAGLTIRVVSITPVGVRIRAEMTATDAGETQSSVGQRRPRLGTRAFDTFVCRKPLLTCSTRSATGTWHSSLF